MGDQGDDHLHACLFRDVFVREVKFEMGKRKIKYLSLHSFSENDEKIPYYNYNHPTGIGILACNALVGECRPDPKKAGNQATTRPQYPTLRPAN